MSSPAHLHIASAIASTDLLHISLSFVGIYLLYLSGLVVYQLFFHPLAKFPGSKLDAISKVPNALQILRGREWRHIAKMHTIHGPVIRIGPNRLSFAAGGSQVWKDIHGFGKIGLSGNKDRDFYLRDYSRETSLFRNNNADHSRVRKILSHGFSDKSLREQEPLIKRWASLLIAKLREKTGGDEEIDFAHYMNCTTFDIMGDLTFSDDLGMLKNGELSPWVKAIFGNVKDVATLRATESTALGRWIVDKYVMHKPGLRQKSAEHQAYVNDRLHARLARGPEHPDLWSNILEKNGRDGQEGITLGEQESNAAFFMVAGTETTATALSGTMYYLLRNPAYTQKLKAELRSAFETFDDVTLEGLARLKYLHAVLQEGLRLFPPVPSGLARVTPPGGATIGGTYVPARTSVGITQFAANRNEANFARADEFHPQRWLHGDDGEMDPRFANDDLGIVEPFSVGPRSCLGKNLAWHELRVLLTAVVMHFDWSLADPSEDWIAQQKMANLWLKTPLMVKVTASAD